MKLFKSNPIGICIHHSLTKDGKIADVNAFRKYHMEVNHWDDCGYHYVIERVNGELTIQNGRNIKYQGAHCPGLNIDHIGLCFAGNFDLEAPDDEMLTFGVEFVQQLIDKYNMNPLTAIKYHNDYSKKSCPGKKFPKIAFVLAVRGETIP